MSPSEKLPVVVLSCQVLQDVLESLLPDDLASQVVYMDYGLHRVPNNMTPTLQEVIDSVEEPSLVVLGYGLCGNGLRGLRAREHTLLAPRADDCIALLLGSYRAYMQEFSSVPGTYYLSKGWLESGSHPLSEYREYEAKYGSEQAAWLMDQQYRHYERLMLVAHTPEDMEAYRPVAQEVARYCQQWEMRYEERFGSDAYVRRLIEAAGALSRSGELPGEMKSDFVVISPGDTVDQDQFMR